MTHLRALFVVPFSLALCLALGACGAAPAADGEQDTPEATQQEQSADAAGQDEAALGEQGDAEADEEAAVLLTRVGQEGIGFVDVPEDFIAFRDVDGGDDLQFSDPSGTSIVTLNTFDMEIVPAEERDSFGAYEAAQAVYANIAADNPVDMQGATVELCSREAYQVYAYYDDGIYLVAWVVADDGGTIHYVSAVGPDDAIMSLVNLVQETYAFEA